MSLEFRFLLGDPLGSPAKRGKPAALWQPWGSWGFPGPPFENKPSFHSPWLSARNTELRLTAVALELSVPIWQLCVSLPCPQVQLHDVLGTSLLAADGGPLKTAQPAILPEKPVKA